jgi:hypothetical protein
MSGGGSGAGDFGSMGAGGGGAVGSDECPSIVDRTILNSPNPAVLPTLAVGATLELTLQSERGPLLAVTPDGRTAGSITSTNLARLIRCIQGGYRYDATVLTVTGGQCAVEVRPASS